MRTKMDAIGLFIVKLRVLFLFFFLPGSELNHQRKWPLTRSGSDGVSSAMPDVVATATHRRGKRTITLWQFLKELLIASFHDPAPIRWLDREKGKTHLYSIHIAIQCT